MFTPPPPAANAFQEPIRLADWVELNILAEEEEVLSVDSVTAELAGEPPDVADDAEFRSPREDPDDPEGESLPAHWNKLENSTADAFRELSSRAGWLQDHYPLRIAGDIAERNHGTATHNVYRFLVLLRARQLYKAALGDNGRVSGFLFEELVKHALGAYIGARSQTQVRFGVAGGTRGDGLPNAVDAAVRELSTRVHEPMGQVPDRSDGDFKADVVTWKPFGDRLPGQLALIGQATISEGDWGQEEPAKRWTYAALPDRPRLIEWLARPVTAVAFPETLSLTPSTTLRGLEFSSIPFDRLRLLKVLGDQELPEDLVEGMRQWGNGVIAEIPR